MMNYNLNENRSIGIRNVNQRIRLIFGEKYGVAIQSIENMGTAVKITIPALSYKEMRTFV